jgi:uncharacterized protein (DUF2235 family)
LKLYRQRLNGADGASDKLRRFRASYSGNVCIDTDDDLWRCRNLEGYTAGQVPRLNIRYLGVWDTVGALGLPSILPWERFINREHAFHDIGLNDFVESARHAVAIDERRSLFPPEPWGDLTALNAGKGFTVDSPNAPYQEKWFPGTHGSVGGGGDVRGLSDGALAWVLKGAKLAGLRLDIDEESRIHGVSPDPLAPLINVRDPGFSLTSKLKSDRAGPRYLWQVSAAAIRRWHAPGSVLPEKKSYRPAALSQVAEALEAHPAAAPVAPTAGAIHTVASGETLGKLARQHYGNNERWKAIFEANRDVLDDPDEIFVGQQLRIPAPPPGGDA